MSSISNLIQDLNGSKARSAGYKGKEAPKMGANGTTTIEVTTGGGQPHEGESPRGEQTPLGENK